MGFSRYYAAQAPGLVLTGEQRATLVRRTYSLVLACVFVTIGGTWFGLRNEAILAGVAQHPIITMLLAFVPLWAASAMRSISAPQRLGLVVLFSAIMGVAISPAIYVAGRTAPDTIWQAGVLTASAFTVLTTYAWLSRRDFSAWGSFFTVGLFVLILASLLNIFFQNQGAQLWIAAVGVLIFSGLLVFDTWRLRNSYGPDHYIQAAVQIYLDLLNMFLFILSLLGGRRSSN
ncbi:MAG: Bax inhibitor-1/YccA family protein [Gemmatimonadaceae bacterium]|nr:Bax inhibitor-1/YccA family protein [Gemmatimonadaceae bacterium]